MKDYKRLTKRCGDIVNYAKPLQSNFNFIGAIYEEQKERDSEIMSRLAELEDKIESGELCERKETAKEILLLLGKGFDETTKKNFKDLPWYESFCRELKFRYGVELFRNSDKLEDKK